MPTTPDHEDRPAEFVEALAKGLAILECFDADHAEMSLSEISRRVDLTPAAVRRSLITLKTLGYVGQTEKRFYLRPKVMNLGSALYFSARIDEVLQPELRHFVGKFGDASSVAALVGLEVLYIAHYSEQRARRPSAVVGARYPAQATSLGQVILAGLPEAEFEDFLARMEPISLTPRTITDKDELRAVIARVREQQYAVTVDQLDYGITALSVPIRGRDGHTVAALNTSAYSGTVSADFLVEERLLPLRQAAARITQTFQRYPVLERIIDHD